MTLPLSIDTLDSIAENARGAYIERDGKYHLNANVPDTAALEKELTSWKRKHEAAEKLAKTAADSAADLQRKLDAKDASGTQTDEKVTALLDKWQKEKDAAVAAARAEEQQKFAPFVDKVTKYELDDVLGQAFMDAGGLDTKRKRAIAQAKIEGWKLEDGKVVRQGADGQLDSATVGDYFTKTFKSEVPEWYKGTQASGGGAAGIQSGGARTGDLMSLSPRERMELGRANAGK